MAVLVVGTCLLTLPAAAQEKASLDQVETLAGGGRTEEAREVLLRWWSESGTAASRRDVQRGLWLRGRLTVDPAQASLDFRRLVVEFPGGAFSDQALLRLAQMAHAAGDSTGAAQQVQRLVREYPSSPARREAEAWLATAGPVPSPLPGVAAAAAPAPVVAAAPPPSAGTPAESAPREFTIQLGAFSSQDRAESLLRRAADEGFEARLAKVPGSDLVRVRVGRFDSQEGADPILRRLLDLGFTAALARDAHREERVGR